MGLADIAFETLESEEVRSAIGEAGTRVFDSSFEEPEQDENGNILGWVWNQGKRLIGFLFEEAGKLINFALTTLWGYFTSNLQFVWNFNWNITDNDINRQIQGRWDTIGSMLGGTLGNFLGYVGCGVVPGAVMFAFNEPLGAYVLANVTEELGEEFLGNLSSLIRLSFISTAQSLMLWSYQNVRKLIKSNVDLVYQIFGDKFGDVTRAWGEEGSKPWSFAMATEETIEKIPNTFIRNFVEEFLEEAWEGCVEAGYVVANSVDSYLAAEKLKQQQMPVNGPNRYVEIKPNRTNDEQRIVLAGPEEILKPVIVQTLTNEQLMGDRDVGIVYNADPDKLGNKRRKGRPKINLYFLQPRNEMAGKEKQLTGLISFRLMEYTSETITLEYLQTLAYKIQQKFGNPPFTWRKGKILYTYADWDLGYQFQLLVPNEAEARRIIEQTLDLRGHSPEWEYMNQVASVTPELRYPEVPDKRTILGKREEMPQRRRNGSVVFRYAQCEVNGRKELITLYDRTKRYKAPLVRDKQ